MPRIFFVCSLIAALLLLPAAAGGQSVSPNHRPAAKDVLKSHTSVIKGKRHASVRAPVHLAKIRARQQQPVSRPRTADPRMLSQTTSAPTSAPAMADGSDTADLDDEDVDNNHADSANVDDEDVDDNHADSADVENGDVEDDDADTADVEEGNENDDHSHTGNVDDGENGDD